MNKREAIEYVKQAFAVWQSEFCTLDGDWSEETEALDLAVEALQDDAHSKDAISRGGLLKLWEELSPRGRLEFDQVIMTIPALPSKESEDI